MDFLPPNTSDLFKPKNVTNDIQTQGAENNFSTNISGKYKTGLFPIQELGKTWNMCPAFIKKIPKLKFFKTTLQDHFISKYESECFNHFNCYPCSQAS